MQVGAVMLGFGLGLVALVSGAVGLKFGLVIAVRPAHARRPGTQLVAAPSHQGAGASSDRTTCPDLLDLMCISVAAGLGLEQAMQVSCARFESPVCHELRLTLREMELGLSRHDALENMKLRTDIDDLVTFAVVLSQADALGLPIGRVLQAQADEMRDKRRQRAREKAAKVPVKILFPLARLLLAGDPDHRDRPHRRTRSSTPSTRPERPTPVPSRGIVRARRVRTRRATGCDCRLRLEKRTMTWDFHRTRVGVEPHRTSDPGGMRGRNGKHSIGDPVAGRASVGRRGRAAGRMDLLHAGLGLGTLGQHDGAPG